MTTLKEILENVADREDKRGSDTSILRTFADHLADDEDRDFKEHLRDIAASTGKLVHADKMSPAQAVLATALLTLAQRAGLDLKEQDDGSHMFVDTDARSAQHTATMNSVANMSLQRGQQTNVSAALREPDYQFDGRQLR